MLIERSGTKEEKEVQAQRSKEGSTVQRRRMEDRKSERCKDEFEYNKVHCEDVTE